MITYQAPNVLLVLIELKVTNKQIKKEKSSWSKIHIILLRNYLNKKEDNDSYLYFTLQEFLKVLQLGNKPLVRSHLRSFTSN